MMNDKFVMGESTSVTERKITILFGKPNSGKGSRLQKFLKGKEDEYKVIAPGKELREAVKNGTELGKKAESYMNAGQLVPDELVIGIVTSAIEETKKKVILDGFPRTVAQAEALLSFVEDSNEDSNVFTDIEVIECFVPDEVAIERAATRIVCTSCGATYGLSEPPKTEGICDKCHGKLARRNDDDKIEERLEVYKNETEPVLEYFENNGIVVVTVSTEYEESMNILSELID